MLFDVAVPEMPPAGVLVYDAPEWVHESSRVIVQIGKYSHTGFILGPTKQNLPHEVEIKPVQAVIDTECVLEPDIWDLALWAGKVSMCGVSSSLRAVLPRAFIDGEKIKAPPLIEEEHKHFRERNCFNPFDYERVNFYLSELEKPERTLILFPTKETAKNFYEQLPESIKTEALLWPSKNIFPAWTSAHFKHVRIVVGSAGAVFAPLRPQKIIIEGEASPSYILPYALNLSARTLAGRRAVMLGAELITAGKIPSLKTYLRTKPKPPEIPDRKNIILADMYHSRKEQEHGIEGTIPLTFSLVKRTYRELSQGHNVLWILDRLGESSEVFCNNCGQSVKCPKCNNIMRSINDGNMLKCKRCGAVIELPEKCGNCGHNFFMGKRPGIEALAKIAEKHYPGVKLYVKGAKKSNMKGLIISTQRGLELCGNVNLSLIAWLDLDLELWSPDDNSRLNVYSMLYESYYRGRERNSDRKVLIQARKDGMKFAFYFAEGWEKFIREELKSRENLMLPPYGFVAEIVAEKRSKITREEIAKFLGDAGLFVMDPGEEDLPLYVSTDSLEAVRKILEPFSRYLKITVRSE